jgi:triacylglycerol lipase
MDAFVPLAVPSIVLALVGLVLFARQQYPSNLPRLYRFTGGLVVLILAAVPAVRSFGENSFLWGVVVGPALAVSAAQLPLAAFDNPRSTRWPIGLLVAAIVLMVAYVIQPGQNSTWSEALVATMGVVGLTPLIASTWRLIRAGWTSDWSSGTPMRRFLFWLAVTLGPLFVHSISQSNDRLGLIGEALIAIGGLAFLSLSAWTVARSVRKGAENAATPMRTAAPALLASAAVALAGFLMAGDILHDRHLSVGAARRWSDVLYGCGASRQFTQVVTDYATRLGADLKKTLAAPVLPSQAIRGKTQLDPELQAAFALAGVSAFAYLSCAEMLEAAKRWNRPGLYVMPLGFGVSLSAETRTVVDCPQGPSRDEAVILYDDRDVVLAFRGTDGLLAAKSDLYAVPTQVVAPEWVHKGFASRWSRIRTETITRLGQLRDRGQTLWITGHSLGGAIAVLAADDLQRAGIPIHAVYTFGQPRVAGVVLARDIERRLASSYRYVLLDDPVPMLGTPTASSIGHLRYIDSSGRVHENPDDRQRILDGRCSGPLWLGAAHGKANYVAALQYAAAGSLGQRR